MSSSDLQVIFPAIILVTILVMFSTFFVVSNNEWSLSDKDLSVVDNPDTPWDETLVGENVTYDENGNPVSDDPGIDWAAIGLGVASLIAGTLIVWAHPIIGIGLLVYGGAKVFGSTTFGSGVLHSLPIIGNILSGVDDTKTAIASFMGLIVWSPDFLGGFPIIGFLILVPLVLFFFIFVIRFIRGQ